MTTTLLSKQLHGANASPLLNSRSFLLSSFLFAQLTLISYSHAAPAGGTVVGGTGTINHSGLTTTINQNTKLMAIDWQSYNVQQNERVHYIQPDASSISLNRILGNNASSIRGQIDANGQVILVNPNGIFFAATATVNVGGLLASGLDIKPTDFMNGNYIFNEVLGTQGTVINSGIINAATGGSVSLLGKQVKNEGMISARLGMVNMAAGNEAVVTFDNAGLLGIKVTKEILQNDIGVDPAVLNTGKITAEGGKILLTASVSQDIFSRAVNTGSLEQATSAVVHADGTFTLGAGADVVNSGTLDVSTTEVNQTAGEIIVVGNNVTSSGVIKADAVTGNGGKVELHATDTTKLTSNSVTSARATVSGNGGSVTILGNKVGLFESARVDVSGANGGGVALIGGDKTGQNSAIRNAEFIYLGENTRVTADATDNGDGGKVITFASNTARIYGDLFARGGVNGGNGGFIETSGLQGFEITKAPDVSAALGLGGEWLIDPYDITIVATVTGNIELTNAEVNNTKVYDTLGTPATIGVDLIVSQLDAGTSVTIKTAEATGAPLTGTEAGNITFATDLLYTKNSSSDVTLTLDAANDINMNAFDIRADWDSQDRPRPNKILNIALNANSDGIGGGDVNLTNANIYTNGGTFTATGVNFKSSGGVINTVRNNYRLSNNGDSGLAGGAVTITATGQADTAAISHPSSISVGGNIITDGGAVSLIANTGVALSGGTIETTATIDTSTIAYDNNNPDRDTLAAGQNVGTVTMTADSTVNIGGSIVTSGQKIEVVKTSGFTSVAAGTLDTTGTGNNDVNGDVIIKSSGIITLGGTIDTNRGAVSLNSTAIGTAGAVTVNGAITTRRGDFTVVDSGQFSNNAAGIIDTSDGGNGAGKVAILSRGTITVDGNVTTNTGTIELNTTGAAAAGEISVGATLKTAGGNVNIGLPVAVNGVVRSTKYTQTGIIDTSGGNVAIASTGTITTGQITTNAGTVNLNTSGIAAAGTVTVNGAISTTGGSVTTVSEVFNSTATGTINSGGGAVLIDSGTATTNDVTIAGNITTSGGSFTATKTNKFSNTAIIDTSGGGGIVDIKSTSTIDTGNIIGGTGAVDFDAIGLVTVSGAVSSRGGNVTVKNSNGFTVATAGSINTSGAAGGAVKVTTTGAVVLNGAIKTNNGAVDFVPGVTSFTADVNGSIDTTVGGGGGSQGTVVINSAAAITTAGNITTNGGAVTVAAATTATVAGIDTGIAVATGTLNITAAGAITANGALKIGGTTTIANTGVTVDDRILLENDANNFRRAVALTNGVDGNGIANVSIKASNGINFAASKLGQGKFSAETTAGNISQSGAITQVAGATTSSSLIATATTGTITLANPANDFQGNLELTAGGTVTIQDVNDIALGKSNVGGNLALTANNGGNITQDMTSGNGITMGVNTTARFNVDGNQSINMGNESNSFQGISFASNDATRLQNVTVTNATALNLQTLSLSGDLKVTTITGSITNTTGSMVVDGLVTLDAAGGAGNITLIQGNNNFNNVVITNANNVSITDINTINIGDANGTVSKINGNLTLISNGNITQTAALTMNQGTTATFTAGVGSINLALQNDFQNIVLNATGNVDITDKNGIIIGDAAGTAASTIGGDLTINANGVIKQTAAITMTTTGATASFTAGGGAIELGTLDNNFDKITVSSTADVSIRDTAGGIQLGATRAGTLTVESTNGNITEVIGDSITVGGRVELLAANNDIFLGTGEHSMSNVAFVGNNVSLRSIDTGMTIQDQSSGVSSVVSGALTIKAQGNIDDAGTNGNFIIGGNADLDAGTGSAITMLQTDFQGTVTAKATDTIKIIDATALQLGTLSAGTEVDLNAGDSMSGGSVTANRVALVANSGINTTTTTANLFVENISGDVVINNSGSVQIESLKNVGDITFNNAGTIRIDPGSIDSGYDAGSKLIINLSSGSFVGNQQADPTNPIADITAYDAILNAPNGDLGSLARPLVLSVNNNLVLNARRSFAPVYIPREPNSVIDTSTFQFSFFDAATAITGEQLIKVEKLEDIDPAIFSDVRNYTYGQVAIRLPRDQLFEDELEDELEAEEK